MHNKVNKKIISTDLIKVLSMVREGKMKRCKPVDPNTTANVQ